LTRSSQIESPRRRLCADFLMQQASRFEGWESCEVDGGSQRGSYLQALRYVEGQGRGARGKGKGQGARGKGKGKGQLEVALTLD